MVCVCVCVCVFLLCADQKMWPRTRRTFLHILFLLAVTAGLLLYVVPNRISADGLKDVDKESTHHQRAISPQGTPQRTPKRTWDNSTLNETKQGREDTATMGRDVHIAIGKPISSPYIADWEHRGVCLEPRRRNNEQNITDNTKLIYYWQDGDSFPKTSRYPDLCTEPIGRSCVLTFDASQRAKADAVIFHGSRIGITKPPFRKRRGQVWVVRALESPPHWLKGYASPAWRGVVNWTMTYRTDSDIFSPVGRLIRLQTPVRKNYKAVASNKTKSVAWFVSKCDTTYKYGSQREKYVKELRKYIDVDIFGECGPNDCSKDHMRRCMALLNLKYRFYLAFENSLCHQYVTEKIFRTYREDIEVVPVVLGKHDYKRYLPEGTFINTADFRSPKDLAKHLRELSKDIHAYTAILERKSQYRSCRNRELPWCTLCEMLHKENMGNKVYKDLYRWWEKGTCDTAEQFYARNKVKV